MDKIEEQPKNIFEFEDPESGVSVELIFPVGTDISRLRFNPKYFAWLAQFIGLSKIKINFESLGKDEIAYSVSGNRGDTLTAKAGKVLEGKKFKINISEKELKNLLLLPNPIRKIPVQININQELIIQKITNGSASVEEIESWVSYLNKYTDNALQELILERFKNQSRTDEALVLMQILFLSLFPVGLSTQISRGSLEDFLLTTGFIDLIFYLGFVFLSIGLKNMVDNDELFQENNITYRFDPILPLGPQISRTSIALLTAFLRKNGLGLSNHFGVVNEVES